MLVPSIVRTMLPTAWMSPGLPPWVRRLFKRRDRSAVLAVTDQRNRAGDIELGISGSGREQWSELAQRLAVAAAAGKNQRPLAGVGLIRAESEPILLECRERGAGVAAPGLHAGELQPRFRSRRLNLKVLAVRGSCRVGLTAPGLHSRKSEHEGLLLGMFLTQLAVGVRSKTVIAGPGREGGGRAQVLVLLRAQRQCRGYRMQCRPGMTSRGVGLRKPGRDVRISRPRGRGTLQREDCAVTACECRLDLGDAQPQIGAVGLALGLLIVNSERVAPAALSFGHQSRHRNRGLCDGAAGDTDERHENQ